MAIKGKVQRDRAANIHQKNSKMTEKCNDKNNTSTRSHKMMVTKNKEKITPFTT